MKLCKFAVPAMLAAGFMASGAYAQGSQKESAAKAGGNLAIEHVTESEAVDRLFESVEKLRQASVLLTDKPAGPERKKAFDAAQDAIGLVQDAMAQLPSGMYGTAVKERAAKDWPVVMARLDEATQELQGAIKAIRQKGQGDQSAAVDSAHKALEKARQAMAALPAWVPGDAGSAATGAK